MNVTDLGAGLRAGYRDHRRYLALSTAVFAVGVVAGVAVYLQGIDLLARLGLDSLRDLFPENITVFTILINNTRAFGLMVLGAITGGLLTLFALLFNGLLIGFVLGGVAADRGIAFVFVGLVPHGIFELPALFAGAAVGLRVVHLTGKRLLGRRDRVLSRREWRETGLFLVGAWTVLAFAAFVEIHVTGTLLEVLFE